MNWCESAARNARLLLDDAEDFFFAHDQEFLAVDLDLGAGVLAEEDFVAGLDVEREYFALVVRLAFSDGDNLALLGFSFALSGIMMPPRTVSPSSKRRTRIRSWSGVKVVVTDVAAIASLLLHTRTGSKAGRGLGLIWGKSFCKTGLKKRSFSELSTWIEDVLAIASSNC